ncbi:bifunctional DNA primase/polymerase [Paramagnetospirillum marisnigri]|uniref:bifunctional DNA primase/polymerase n=1 Tax=Paramagnetospirillum marisnigri TaxID=1285242 RepID=UPI0009EE1108|nr:bifunctional DNA primase/polymerase [Paramagnetospirillum marisnigri]
MTVLVMENWRFTPVLEKSPVTKDWTNKPLAYEQIDFTKYGYGLLLGPLSSGVMALDFDGTEAIEFYQQQFQKKPTNSVMWTSGKPGRAQIAYSVPEEYWASLKTIKVGPGKKLEFRWAGSQSVIPPSPHPETGRYRWINQPTCSDDLKTIPKYLMDFWLEKCSPPQPQRSKAVTRGEEFTVSNVTPNKLEKALMEAAKRDSRPTYDDWRLIAFACASECGVEIAKSLMQRHFPAERSGEYDALFRGYDHDKSPRFGSLIHYINNH